MTEAQEEICYRCGDRLNVGERQCPACGRRQYRTCYCGAVLHKSLGACPTCGAQWPSRTARTARKRRPLRWRPLLSYAAGGAMAALLLSAVLAWLVGQAAGWAAARSGVPLPNGIGSRFVLVLHALGDVVAERVAAQAGDLGNAIAALVIVAVGAGAGTLLYLRRIEVVRWRRSRAPRRRPSGGEV